MEFSGTDLIKFHNLCTMTEGLASTMRRLGKNSSIFLTRIRFCSIYVYSDKVKAEVTSNVTGESGHSWSFEAFTWDDFLKQIESRVMVEAGIKLP